MQGVSEGGSEEVYQIIYLKRTPLAKMFHFDRAASDWLSSCRPESNRNRKLFLQLHCNDDRNGIRQKHKNIIYAR